MSRLATSLLVAALTLPLVAYVAGVMATPEDPAPDRSRPVIIGNVDDDGADRETRDDQPTERRDRPSEGPAVDRCDDEDDGGDENGDDGPEGPVAVTPAPRDPGDEDEVGDDGGDDDQSDDGGDDSGGD